MRNSLSVGLALCLATASASVEAKRGATTSSGPVELSPYLGPWTSGPASAGAPVIGLVADSQFQSQNANNFATVFKGAFQDKHVTNVTLRPPALDWGARHLLVGYLEKLREQNVSVIFYLGDGANNGCQDELLAGWSGDERAKSVKNPGILRVLHDFRMKQPKIPVYYVLGNHDFLGAGNTSNMGQRKRLCTDDPVKKPNPPVSKLTAIKEVDAFNRDNASINPALAGTYLSNVMQDPEPVRSGCEGANGRANANQGRHRGCFLAATVAYALPGGKRLQFLLLDTNDYVDVSASNLVYQFEGARGAMSFKDSKTRASQTTWFVTQIKANPADTRIALSHYPITALQSPLPFVHYTQRFMDLFAKDATPSQTAAYMISAHTHTPVNRVSGTTINSCDGERCGYFGIGELNIGSTTDFATGATVARLMDAPSGHGLEYRELKLAREDCVAALAPLSAPGAPLTWASIGVDARHPTNYRRFKAYGRTKDYPDGMGPTNEDDPKDIQDLDRETIYQILDAQAGGNARLAQCIALWASEVEGPQ